MNDDPFAGIDTLNLPERPSKGFIDEVGKLVVQEPETANESLIRGVKRQTIETFVQYIKEQCSGEAHADMSVSFSMTFEELESIKGRFLEK